jgi:Flp pilus assembly protein TadB
MELIAWSSLIMKENSDPKRQGKAPREPHSTEQEASVKKIKENISMNEGIEEERKTQKKRRNQRNRSMRQAGQKITVGKHHDVVVAVVVVAVAVAVAAVVAVAVVVMQNKGAVEMQNEKQKH